MKFTDGFWQLRPGVTALYSQEAYDIWETAAGPNWGSAPDPRLADARPAPD